MGTVATAKDTPLPTIIYAAKSSADPRGSIPTQLSDCHAAIEAEGRTFVSEHRDERKSAYKGNRGPGLAAALEAATEAAELHDEAELWVQHSDRLARGSGRRDEARHLGALYFECLAAGVQLRSVQDDDNLRDAIRAVLVGERNHEDSARKSAATIDGLRRAAQRGDWLGGRVPDGYLKLPRQEREPRRLALDPERAAIIEKVLAYGLAGMTSGATARELNAAGVLAKKVAKGGGFEFGEWTSCRVRQVWEQPHYAGLLRIKGKIVGEGNWPRLIDPADWRRLQRITAARSEATRQGGRPGQRPTYRHLLAGLGRCGRCGGAMHAVSSTPRVDGTVPRRYLCAPRRESRGTCDAPRIDAELVERPFLAQLDALAVDLEGWIRERATELEADRGAVAKSVAAAERRVGELDGEADRIRADYRRQLAAGNDAAAQVAADALADVDREREQAEHRARELRAVLDAAETAAPAGDAVLDLYAKLQRAIAGHVEGETVREVNERLREALSHIVMDPQPDGSVRLRAYLAAAFMATVETDPETFAEAYTANLGLPAEADADGVAVRLDTPPLRPVTVSQGPSTTEAYSLVKTWPGSSSSRAAWKSAQRG
jgi:site-specific DNA recombinase